MNTQTQEALKMAIEALTLARNETESFLYIGYENAIKACKEALEQPAQCIELEWYNKGWTDANWEWQGLTDDEIEELGLDLSNPAGEFVGLSDWKIFARAIEQALKEKNHG
jgi:hypothetical protein